MITQSINLNLIAGQVLPRVNASQYDNNSRTLTMYLYDGELAFNIPNGVSGYIQGTKPDRTGFQYLATVAAGSNVVTFDITEQMTAVAGDVTCELVLVDGDDRIATVNFILHVEPAALSDDTVISETDLPLIEEAAELAQQIGGFIEQMDADAAKSEAYGAGTVNGVPVTSDNPAYENNAKYYSDEAAASASGVEQLKEDSEAYAVGTRDGVPVTSGDATYHNNSKYYANAASGSASTAVASDIAAAQSKEDAEAWAVGERDNTPVTSGDATYHNNSKYYADEAADSASNASTSETNAGLSETAAAQSEEDAEAWANGTRNGTPVASGDPAYHNNAKHWAEEASGTVNDMVGATASADGTHGLVPQPLMGDQSKVLTGGGTWAALGAAAAKGATNSVTQHSTDLVESGAVYSGLAAKVDKTNLSSIEISGNTNNTGSAISEGTYFYKDGLLVKALASIANNASLTLNNNYKNVTEGALNELNRLSRRYGVTVYNYEIGLALADGISNTNAYLQTAKSSLASWLHNRPSDELIHIDRVNIFGTNMVNTSSRLADNTIGLGTIALLNLVDVILVNGTFLIYDSSGLNYFYELSGSTFTDRGTQTPTAGSTISAYVTIFKKGVD